MLSMKEHTTANGEIIFRKTSFKSQKLILESNSRSTNLARGSVHASKIGWAHGENYWTQISNQGAPVDLRMYKTPKSNKYKYIIFLLKRYFLDGRVQNVPENSQKLRCLVAFQNRPNAPMMEISWISNFSKDSFVKKSLPLSTRRNLTILLHFPFSICVFQQRIFNLEIQNKCKPMLWAVSLLKIFV